jgi:integrase
LVPTLGDRRISEIDVEVVEGFIAALKRGEAVTAPAPDTTDRRRHPRAPTKLSNRRVNIIVKVLRQSLDRAVSKGWLSDNPARRIDLLREEKPEIDPFSVDDAKTFISEGLQDDEQRRYFRVAFFSGLRPGEQIGLQWGDVDWQRRMIRVRRSVSCFGKGPTKTIESRRDVEMLPIVEQALRSQRPADSPASS